VITAGSSGSHLDPFGHTQGRLRENPMPKKHFYVYLLTNWNNRVMYVGVTNDLQRRLYEHKNKLVKGFTEKYSVDKLVYFEQTNDVISALAREKEIKKWRREKKDKLVVSINPEWKDLSEGIGFLPSVEMTR
jgi:putative endonuclease